MVSALAYIGFIIVLAGSMYLTLTSNVLTEGQQYQTVIILFVIASGVTIVAWLIDEVKK